MLCLNKQMNSLIKKRYIATCYGMTVQGTLFENDFIKDVIELIFSTC